MLTTQLLFQMQSSLAYVRTSAPPAAIAGQPLLSTFAEAQAQAEAANHASHPNSDQPAPELPPPPPSQEQFQQDVHTMSRDLVLKEQQIEMLVASLPGLDTSEKEQVERMKELEKELEDLEEERLRAVKEKDGLVRMVEERIGSVGVTRGRG
jgi:mediator of RNA polymerase II transcription subunit 21